MQAAEVVRALWASMEARAWDRVRALVADALVVHWPQTKERIGSGDAYVTLNRTYPGDWHLRVDEVVAEGDRAAARVTITDGARVFFACGFYRVENGRVIEAVETFAEPTEPPYERGHLAERTG